MTKTSLNLHKSIPSTRKGYVQDSYTIFPYKTVITTIHFYYNLPQLIMLYS